MTETSLSIQPDAGSFVHKFSLPSIAPSPYRSRNKSLKNLKKSIRPHQICVIDPLCVPDWLNEMFFTLIFEESTLRLHVWPKRILFQFENVKLYSYQFTILFLKIMYFSIVILLNWVPHLYQFICQSTKKVVCHWIQKIYEKD